MLQGNNKRKTLIIAALLLLYIGIAGADRTAMMEDYERQYGGGAYVWEKS